MGAPPNAVDACVDGISHTAIQLYTAKIVLPRVISAQFTVYAFQKGPVIFLYI